MEEEQHTENQEELNELVPEIDISEDLKTMVEPATNQQTDELSTNQTTDDELPTNQTTDDELPTNQHTEDGPYADLLTEKGGATSLQTEDGPTTCLSETDQNVSTDSSLPGIKMLEAESKVYKGRPRGRPRKSESPKKLNEAQLSEIDGKTDFMLVTPSLKRRRGRPPNPLKSPKIPSDRGPGRPRINPPKIGGFGRPMDMTKTLQIRLVKCSMRDGKRRGRPPGAKNRIKVESMKDGKRRGRPPGAKNRINIESMRDGKGRGRPPGAKNRLKIEKPTKGDEENVAKKPRGRPPKIENGTSNTSMSYQDFVRQVNAELLAINGTDESTKDDVIQNEKTTEMDFTDNEMDTSVYKKRGRPPGAKNKQHKSTNEASSVSPSPQRKPGRPPGSKDTKPRKSRDSVGLSDDEIMINIEQSTPGSPKKKHRGPGRPKKEHSGPGRPRKEYKDMDNPNKMIKRPGRPKKEQQDPDSPIKATKSPGRPKKQQDPDSPLKATKRPGRPKKQQDLDSPVKATKKPGRPMKREQDTDGPIKANKRPGRPKKKQQDTDGPIKAKKSPGRPKKEYTGPEQATKPLQDVLSPSPNRDSLSGKKRGRPKGAKGRIKTNDTSFLDENRLSRHCKGEISYMESMEEIIEVVFDSDTESDEEEIPIKQSAGRPLKRKRGRPSLSESIKRRKTDGDSPRKVGRPRKDNVLKERSCKSHIDYVAMAEGKDIEESSEKESNNDSSEVAATVNVTLVKNSSDSKQKRGKGRPKKSLATSNEFSTDDSVSESIFSGDKQITKVTKKGKRGRPKKDTWSSNMLEIETSVHKVKEVVKLVEKKSVGRPKKYVKNSDLMSVTSSNVSTNVITNKNNIRRPGRPKKSVAIAIFTSDDDSQNEGLINDGEQSVTVLFKKRPGRPKKIVHSNDLTSESDNRSTENSSMELEESQRKNEKRRPGRPKRVNPALETTVTSIEGNSADTSGISSITMEGWEGFSSNNIKRRGRPKKINKIKNHDKAANIVHLNGIESDSVSSIEKTMVLSPESEIASKNFDNNVKNSGDQLVSIPSTSIPDNSSQMLVDADIVNSSNHNASEEPILNSSQDKTSQQMEDVDIGKSSENVTAEIDIHPVPQTNMSIS